MKLLLLQFLLLYAAGLSVIGGNKGILGSGILISVLNYFMNYPQEFWYWQGMILCFTLLGILLNSVLNSKTDQLRLIKVSAGSAASLLAAGFFMPLIPAFVAWTVLMGIPLGFTYRDIGKVIYWQMIFKFIFSSGWLIIGNIL